MIHHNGMNLITKSVMFNVIYVVISFNCHNKEHGKK